MFLFGLEVATVLGLTNIATAIGAGLVAARMGAQHHHSSPPSPPSEPPTTPPPTPPPPQLHAPVLVPVMVPVPLPVPLPVSVTLPGIVRTPGKAEQEKKHPPPTPKAEVAVVAQPATPLMP